MRRLDSLRHRVRVLCPSVEANEITTEAEARAALQKNASDPLGFLQFFNLHRSNETVARVSVAICLWTCMRGFTWLSPRPAALLSLCSRLPVSIASCLQVALGQELAAVAAQLLGVRRVRVYQVGRAGQKPGFVASYTGRVASLSYIPALPGLWLLLSLAFAWLSSAGLAVPQGARLCGDQLVRQCMHRRSGTYNSGVSARNNPAQRCSVDFE